MKKTSWQYLRPARRHCLRKQRNDMTNDLTLKTFTVNFIEENCYVLSDATREAVIVDCGAFFPEEQAAIRQYVEEQQLDVRHLLCTHGHFDHVFGVQFIHDTYGILPEMCVDEVDTYRHSGEQMRQFLHRDLPLSLPEPGTTFTEGDVITFGTHTLRIIATPGHTPGGVCFYCPEAGILLSGDSLFRREIGRCDLPGGSEPTLVKALKDKIVNALPADTTVYSGHGPATTVGEERQENYYLQ